MASGVILVSGGNITRTIQTARRVFNGKGERTRPARQIGRRARTLIAHCFRDFRREKFV
jgi:hypothetical protein